MKIMKKIQIKNYFTGNLVFTLIVTLAVYSASCSFGEFNRSTAAGLIEKENQYTAPATMTIDVGRKLTNAAGKAWQISNDDTAEAAAVRAKEDFGTRHPAILVAEQMGYIELNFEEPELGGKQIGMPYELSRQDLGVWYFKVRAKITDKGRKLWTDLGMNVDEQNLPLAVRQSPEVTGIKDVNKNMKSADFTYKWEATELGRAYEPESAEFKKLPANLQEQLQKRQYNIFGGGGSSVMDFSTTRQGVVYFNKFDDGWRLDRLHFL